MFKNHVRKWLGIDKELAGIKSDISVLIDKQIDLQYGEQQELVDTSELKKAKKLDADDLSRIREKMFSE